MIARALAPARTCDQSPRVHTRRSVLIAAGLALGILVLQPRAASAGIVETELDGRLTDRDQLDR